MKKIFLSFSQKDITSGELDKINSDFKKFGYEIINLEKKYYNFDEPIENIIQNMINRSQMIIALITNHDPNTYFEIGYGLGNKKEIVIIAPPEIGLPHFLNSVTFILSEPPFDNIAYKIIPVIERLEWKEQEIDLNKTELPILLAEYEKDHYIFEKIESKQFEKLIFRYLKDLNFNPIREKERHDYGYDFIIKNFKGHKNVLVEVKKYNPNTKISILQVQQLFGAINAYNADAGLLITTGNFTKSSIDFVNRIDKPIYLMTLSDLIKNASIKN